MNHLSTRLIRGKIVVPLRCLVSTDQSVMPDCCKNRNLPDAVRGFVRGSIALHITGFEWRTEFLIFCTSAFFQFQFQVNTAKRWAIASLVFNILAVGFGHHALGPLFGPGLEVRTDGSFRLYLQ